MGVLKMDDDRLKEQIEALEGFVDAARDLRDELTAATAGLKGMITAAAYAREQFETLRLQIEAGIASVTFVLEQETSLESDINKSLDGVAGVISVSERIVEGLQAAEVSLRADIMMYRQREGESGRC
jgi:predicted naringenin-chalcone synthase